MNNIEENNIGLDFGTTYSVISELLEKQFDENGKLVSYKLDAPIPFEGAMSASQESVVLKNEDDELIFGASARSEMGIPGTTLYKGFKMMLAEENPEMFRERGYTEEYTPEVIITEYINYILNGYMHSKGDKVKINKLVLGVPEVWFENAKTIDCRLKLENLVKSYDYVNEVSLVSEPAAACAFFLDNYKRAHGNNFSGDVLLIDFGGGTLDLVLCHAKDLGDSCEVSVKQRCGDGLNEGKQIGKAGFAFMEKVAKLALEAAEFDMENLESNILYECIYKIEDALKDSNSTTKIKKAYEFEILEILEYTEIKTAFCRFVCDRKIISVTYGMLAQAYEDVIKDSLDKRLREMSAFLPDKNYKIQLIGGFCNFYLVQRQVEEFLDRNVQDFRFEGVIEDKRDRECAVSYGATLIANEIIQFKLTAPFHFGFARGDQNEYTDIYYVIKKGMEFIENQPYFWKLGEDDMVFRADKIPLFAYNPLNDGNDRPSVAPPLKKYEDALKLGNMGDNCYKIGFSLDQSLIITLHIVTLNNETEEEIDSRSVVLDNVAGIFGGIIPAGRR